MTKKIGLHTIGGYSGSWGPSPVIKLVDASPEFWGQVRGKVGANVLMIWRHTLNSMPLNDPVQNARDFYNTWRSQILACLGYGGKMAVSAYNEIPDELRVQYNQFLVEWLRLCHLDKVPALVGDWSVGTPDTPNIAAYTGAVNAMLLGDILGFHEYWVDNQDISNIWHCGRFSMSSLFMSKEIVVTECGRDVVEGQGMPGYQYTCTDDEFVMDLIKYDEVLQKYSNVRGATVFTGGDSISYQYRMFNVNGMWPKVIAEMETTSTPPSPSPTVIYEPPMKIIGKCFNEQEVRAYLRGLDYSTWKPREIWLHHTQAPTLADWRGEQSIWAMKAYYDKQPWTDSQGRTHIGWGSGPHFFVAPEGIWAFTPANEEGSHVIGHNTLTIGIEMVGDYDQVRPGAPILEFTCWLIEQGCKLWGLLPENLMFHRDASSKTCPGAAVTKAWIIPQVRKAYNLSDGLPQDEGQLATEKRLEKAIWWSEEARRWLALGFNRRTDDILANEAKWLYENL